LPPSPTRGEGGCWASQKTCPCKQERPGRRQHCRRSPPHHSTTATVNESGGTWRRNRPSTTGAPGRVRLPITLGASNVLAAFGSSPGDLRDTGDPMWRASLPLQVERQRFSAPAMHDEDSASCHVRHRNSQQHRSAVVRRTCVWRMLAPAPADPASRRRRND
jgi:hypothetical protein